jgi:hypothetical protein
VADTSSGLLVCAATYSGAAIVAIPLPSADIVLAVHSFANRPPSDRGAAATASVTLRHATCAFVRAG